MEGDKDDDTSDSSVILSISLQTEVGVTIAGSWVGTDVETNMVDAAVAINLPHISMKEKSVSSKQIFSGSTYRLLLGVVG